MPKHRRLETFRHLGLDVLLHRPALQLLFLLIEAGALATFATLSSNSIRRTGPWFPSSEWSITTTTTTDSLTIANNTSLGTTTISSSLSSYDCESSPGPYVKQPSNALASWCFVALGIAIFYIFCCDVHIAYDRHKAIQKGFEATHPYSLGPGGEGHVRVTALASYSRGEQPQFEGVDPEYLRGNHPSLMRREPLWSLAFSLVFIYLGISNFIYHVIKTPLALRLSSFGMFCTLSLFTAYIGARMIDGLGNSPSVNLCCCFEPCGVVCNVRCDANARRRGSTFITILVLIMAGGVNTGAWFWLVINQKMEFPVAIYAIMVLCCSIGLYVHYWARNKEVDTYWSFGILGGFLFTLGWMFWFYEEQLCISPTNIFQAHAVWLVCLSFSWTCLYMMLRGDAWRYDTMFASEYVDPHKRENAYRIPSLAPVKRTSQTQNESFEVNMDTMRDSLRRDSQTSGGGAAQQQKLTTTSKRGSVGADSYDSASGLYAHNNNNSNVKRPSNSSSKDNNVAVVVVPVAGRKLKVREDDNNYNRPRVPSLDKEFVANNNNNAITNPPLVSGDGSLRRVESVASHGSNGSAGRSSSIRLDALRAQAVIAKAKKEKEMNGGDDRGSVAGGSVHSGHSGVSSIAYWTCPHCGYHDNEVNWVVCERCEEKRPNELVQQSDFL
jgi:hypothetical protein